MTTIIVYSTKYGSVNKVAKKLQNLINGEVKIVNVNSNHDIEKYDTVILGSSVYYGGIQKEMKSFINDNLSKFNRKRVVLYLCAGTDKEKVIESYFKKSYPPVIYQKAIAKENLGYEYDFKRISFIEKLILRLIGVKKSEVVFFDDKIKDFANIVNI